MCSLKSVNPLLTVLRHDRRLHFRVFLHICGSRCVPLSRTLQWILNCGCHHVIVRPVVTCPVSCWHIHGWLVVGARCRRAEPLGGLVPLFAVVPHLGVACRLQTRLRAGLRHHVLKEQHIIVCQIKHLGLKGKQMYTACRTMSGDIRYCIC